MSDDDKKKAFGLVQPPLTIPEEPGIQHTGPMAGMTGAQRDAYMSQGRSEQKMPTIHIPNREDRDSKYVDHDEMSSFGPPKPTPGQMEDDRFQSWWDTQMKAEGAKDAEAARAAGQKAWYERGGTRNSIASAKAPPEAETTDERTRRYQQKAAKLGPQAWHDASSDDPEHPAPTKEELESGKRNLTGWRGTVQKAGHDYAEFMDPQRGEERGQRIIKAAPQFAQPTINKAVAATKALFDKGYAPREPTVDEKLEDIKQQVREAQRSVDAKNGIRQPISMEREFTNEDDKRAYITRKATENAKKKQ